jgi:sarcosine oxidase, subunit beta
METADVVIVGGGVMGCSLAFQLASRGVDVLLLERETLGSQSTGRCAGGVRQQFSAEGNVRLQRLSVRLLERFEAEVGGTADFRQIGYLFLFTRPEQVDDFQAQLRMWHQVGLVEARWVTPEEVRDLSPIVAIDDVLGGTFCPSDGIASPIDVTYGYAAAARRLGARIREGVAVTGIDAESGRVNGVQTSEGSVATSALFNCAGPWAAELGRMVNVDVPVLPYRRYIFVSDGFPAVSRNNPMTIDFTTSLYFHPEGDGVLFGMRDRDEPPGYSLEVDWSYLEKIGEVAAVRAPSLLTAGVKTGWAGLYEVTPDNQPILGPVDSLQGFWCACGFSGHGFQQAPAVGLLLAQLFVEGHSELDLTPFSHRRFTAAALEPELNVI